MRERPFQPGHLDVEAFAQRAGMLSGQLSLRDLPRLLDAAHPEALPGQGDRVEWRAAGERRKARGAADQTWLHLQASARISLVCQRCLGPVEETIAVDAHFRFVAAEAEAAQADLDAEEDVLASTRALDLPALVEDELLLALPLVPRHTACPEPLVADHGLSVDAESIGSDRQRPFEALAGFKARKRLD